VMEEFLINYLSQGVPNKLSLSLSLSLVVPNRS